MKRHLNIWIFLSFFIFPLVGEGRDNLFDILKDSQHDSKSFLEIDLTSGKMKAVIGNLDNKNMEGTQTFEKTLFGVQNHVSDDFNLTVQRRAQFLTEFRLYLGFRFGGWIDQSIFDHSIDGIRETVYQGNFRGLNPIFRNKASLEVFKSSDFIRGKKDYLVAYNALKSKEARIDVESLFESLEKTRQSILSGVSKVQVPSQLAFLHGVCADCDGFEGSLETLLKRLRDLNNEVNHMISLIIDAHDAVKDFRDHAPESQKGVVTLPESMSEIVAYLESLESQTKTQMSLIEAYSELRLSESRSRFRFLVTSAEAMKDSFFILSFFAESPARRSDIFKFLKMEMETDPAVQVRKLRQGHHSEALGRFKANLRELLHDAEPVRLSFPDVFGCPDSLKKP